MNAFLVAQQLLAAEHEGHTLRGEYSGLCQQVETDDFVKSGLTELAGFAGESGDAGLEPVDETHIIVTGDIAYHLGGFQGPRCLAVVDLRHVDLRMLDAAHNAELQALLQVGGATQNAGFGIVVEGTA